MEVLKENTYIDQGQAFEAGVNRIPDKGVMTAQGVRNTAGIDRRLVGMLKEGDHNAFETIFHSFYPRVKSFLRVMTRSEDMADELTQKVFVNLWSYRGSIDPARNFNAYIYTMARNAAMTALKVQLKNAPSPFENVDVEGNELADDVLIARETELLVKMTVSRMPDKRKQVYEMSRYEYKTNDEISKELNISKKVVERHLRLALSEIKEVVRAMVVIFF